ncbi:uncharacterized protein METZ01_LOCUS207210, partial [marine metagenome]
VALGYPGFQDAFVGHGGMQGGKGKSGENKCKAITGIEAGG